MTLLQMAFKVNNQRSGDISNCHVYKISKFKVLNVPYQSLPSLVYGHAAYLVHVVCSSPEFCLFIDSAFLPADLDLFARFNIAVLPALVSKPVSWQNTSSSHGCSREPWLAQGHVLREQQQQIKILSMQLTQLLAAASATLMPSVAMSLSKPSFILQPKQYAGSQTGSWGFMLQCSLNFLDQEGLLEHTKIAHFINLLTDKALAWAMAVWTQGHKHTVF